MAKNGRSIAQFYSWILDEISIAQWIRTALVLNGNCVSQRRSDGDVRTVLLCMLCCAVL